MKMDFSDPEMFPQYNPPAPPASCPRPERDDLIERARTFDEMVHITCHFCRVFICPFIERDEVHAPGL